MYHRRRYDAYKVGRFHLRNIAAKKITTVLSTACQNNRDASSSCMSCSEVWEKKTWWQRPRIACIASIGRIGWRIQPRRISYCISYWRGTKDFEISFSDDPTGDFSPAALRETLSDVRGIPCQYVPLETFNLPAQPNGRYMRIRVLNGHLGTSGAALEFIGWDGEYKSKKLRLNNMLKTFIWLDYWLQERVCDQFGRPNLTYPPIYDSDRCGRINFNYNWDQRCVFLVPSKDKYWL